MLRQLSLLIVTVMVGLLLLDNIHISSANTFLACDNNQGETYSSDGCNKCTCINGETFCETKDDCKENKVVLLDKRDDCPRGKYYHNGDSWCGCKNGITSCVRRGRRNLESLEY